VADEAGVTRSAIQLYESWQRGLSLRLAGMIARVFSSSTGFFIEEGRAKKTASICGSFPSDAKKRVSATQLLLR